MKKTILTVLALILALPLGIMLFGGDSEDEETLTTSLSSNIPSQYADVVSRAGSICEEITPAIIAAQIDAESGWNPTIESPAGAQGIAQFIPETWASNGLDGDGDGIADVLNPIDAIWSQGNLMCSNVAGVKALIAQGTISGDVVELALAGYNAGMGAVQAYGGVPPFTETQDYIKKILALATSTYAGGAVLASSETGAAILEWAKSQTGAFYMTGGRGPASYDCCGLVAEAIENVTGKTAPMSIPGNPWVTSKCEYALLARAAEYGGTAFTYTDISELQPGDIMFFQNPAISESTDYITHVGIYAGNGELTNAEDAGVGTWPLTRYSAVLYSIGQAVRIGD